MVLIFFAKSVCTVCYLYWPIHVKFQLPLRKKCPYSELFWSAFFPHFLAFRLNTLSVFSPMRENADQNNSEYGTFYAVISWRTQMQFQMASFRNLFRALLAFTAFLYGVILEHLLLNCVSLNMNGGFCWFCNFHIYQQFLTQSFDDHQIYFIIW